VFNHREAFHFIDFNRLVVFGAAIPAIAGERHEGKGGGMRRHVRRSRSRLRRLGRKRRVGLAVGTIVLDAIQNP
jgi:hypothetical protein